MDFRARSRVLRHASTDAEQALWQRVRARQLGGYKFRRQVPIARFIADLVCGEGKLVVELDGSQHQQRTEEDEWRTKQLERHGYRVIRVWNTDVLQNIDGVLEALLSELQRNDGMSPTPPGGPSP